MRYWVSRSVVDVKSTAFAFQLRACFSSCIWNCSHYKMKNKPKFFVLTKRDAAATIKNVFISLKNEWESNWKNQYNVLSLEN